MWKKIRNTTDVESSYPFPCLPPSSFSSLILLNNNCNSPCFSLNASVYHHQDARHKLFLLKYLNSWVAVLRDSWIHWGLFWVLSWVDHSGHLFVQFLTIYEAAIIATCYYLTLLDFLNWLLSVCESGILQPPYIFSWA